MPQQQVNIPGVGIVKFPETMSRDEIDAASAQLHRESLGPMKWSRERGPGEAAPGPGLFRRMGRAMQEPGRESLMSQSPGLSPVERANLRSAQSPVTPSEKPTTLIGDRFQQEGAPGLEELKRMTFEPLIPMEPTAQKLWPKYEGMMFPEQVERGVGIGMAILAEGFTSPMTIATIGLAGIGSALSQTLRVLIGIGFTGQLAADAIIKAPELVTAVHEGRYDDAASTGTQMLGAAGLAGMIGKHTLKAGASHPAVTGRGLIVDPRGPGGGGRPLEPRVFQEGAGLEVLPAHERSLFPGRPTELQGTPATGQIAGAPETVGAGRPPTVSTQGYHIGGEPAQPFPRALLPEAPGYDIPGAGEGRLFRGGARMGEPAPGLIEEPLVRGEQTRVPEPRLRSLFEDPPSNVQRAGRLAPDFVGPPEPPVRPETGQRLLGPGPDVALPPGGGPMVTRVQPGEPGGLEPFRQGDIVPQGRPGVPARVREPGRFPVREIGDPSSDLLMDEPTVRPEGPITPEVLPPESTAVVPRETTELTFEEAEAQGKVKVSRFPKSRRERGNQWYKPNSMEQDIMAEGGLKLDLNRAEDRAMIMPNMGATRRGRGRNMFDPIRAVKGEDAMTIDQMFHVLQESHRIPANWTQADFEAALTDRTPGTGGTFPMEAEADIFEKLDALNEAQRPADFAPEAPERLVPDVGERMAPDTRAAGEPPRTMEQADADWEKGRAQIKAMRDEPGYAGTDFEALEVENNLIRQQNIDRIQRPKPTTIGPGFAEPKVEPETPKADIPPKPKDTVRGDTLRHETLEELEARQEVMDKGFEDQIDAFVEGYGEVGFQVPMGRGRYAILHESTRPEEGAWQTSYFDDRGPSGHHMSANWKDAVTDLQNQFRVDLTEARVKGQPNLDRASTDMKGYDLEAEEARNRSLRGEAADPFRKAAEAPTEEFPERVGLKVEEPKVEPEGPDLERIRGLKTKPAPKAEITQPEVTPEAPGLLVKRAEGFNQADGEWGVFRRDPSGKEALVKQFKTETDARWWLDQQGRKPKPQEPGETPFADDPNVNLFMEDLKGTAEEPKVKREGKQERLRREAADAQALRADIDEEAHRQIAEIKAEPKVEPEADMARPQWEIKKTQGGDWGVYKDGNLQIRKATEAEAADSMRGIQNSGEEGSFTYTEEQFDPGKKAADQFWKSPPAEKAVEPEVKPEGQVEIVGHEGFKKESRLADDKAKLKMIQSAKPDQKTAAGRNQIVELGKREKALRKSIAEQERALRGESDIEQAGMFAEDEPPLFRREPTPEAELPKEETEGLYADEPKVEPEGKKPPRVPEEEKAGLYSEEPKAAEAPTEHASDYVDSLVKAASKPGSPITEEIAGFAKAYLAWKSGAQAETAPRLAGPMAKSVKGLIDQLVESDKPRPEGPPGQSTLYMNPVQPIMDYWSRKVGPKIWKYVASTKEPYGIFVKPWPEPLKWLFINRHGQPPKWVERHQEWQRKTEQGATDAFQIGKETTHKLSQQDQQLLGGLMKGKLDEGELRAMRENPEWQTAVDAIKTARSKFDEYGSLAAEQGLLKRETFFKNYGKYMPRLYRRYEVDYDAQLRKWRVKKPTRLDEDRFKKRDDIPEEIRMLMGEILEPGYPIAKGLAQLIHDVETSKLFNFVADNPDWSFEPETFASLGKDPKHYTLMPETTKLGSLSGRYVNKYIASEINQMTKARGEMEKVSKRLVSEWKFNKVIFNPATHGRNMLSNTMLAYLSGLPPWRVDIYAKAMKELWNQEGEYYQGAKDAGLFSTTFSKGELAPLVDSWNATSGGFYDRIAGMSENFSKGEVSEGLSKVLPSGTKAGQRAAKIYQGEESWFKLAKYIQEMENGATPKAAAAAAQKALFDYTEVPPFVAWARTSPIGAPFLTFTYKALPQILETGITHPWRLGSIVASIYAAEEWARSELDIDEDQLAYLKRIMPDRMKGNPLGLGPKALLLPFKDKYGQLQFLDLTYILPWGDVGETGATGILQGSPIHAGPMRAIYEISLNKSAFTGMEIWNKNDSKKVVTQKISDHLYKWAMPSLAPPVPGVTEGGYGFERIWKSVWGQEDYFGRTSAPTTAIASSIIGLKTNPLNPDIELFFRQKEFEDGFDEITAAAYKVQNHQGIPEEEKIKQLDELRERMRVLRQIAQDTIYGPEDSQPATPPPGAPGEPQVQPEQ